MAKDTMKIPCRSAWNNL